MKALIPEMETRLTWENNITFDHCEEEFERLFSSVRFKFAAKLLRPYTKHVMKKAWIEAKRHEALTH